MDYAMVECKRVILPFNKYRLEFKWVGENNVARIADGAFMELSPDRVGREFWLGDLHLVATNYDVFSDIYEVALADGTGYQRLYNRRLYYFLDNLKCRLILTLYVWGLAHFEQDERITWGNVGRKKK